MEKVASNKSAALLHAAFLYAQDKATNELITMLEICIPRIRDGMAVVIYLRWKHTSEFM